MTTSVDARSAARVRGEVGAHHDLRHGGEAAGAGEHLAGDAGTEDGGHGSRDRRRSLRSEV